MQLAGRRILVLEDEFLLALEAQDALEEAGAAVVGPASTIEKALFLIASVDRIDAAVLDLNINGRFSTPVAEALAHLNVPYVFATGYGSDHAAVRGKPTLAKPYMPHELIRSVNNLFSKGWET